MLYRAPAPVESEKLVSISHPCGLTRELNFNVPPVTVDCDIQGEFVLCEGAAKLTTPLVLKFHEPVVFITAVLRRAQGPNYVCIDHTTKHFTTGLVSGPALCKVLRVHAHPDSELQSIRWQKLHPSSTLPVLPEGEELFNTPGIIWQNAKVVDQVIQPGAIAHFNPPAIIYNTSCEVRLFNQSEVFRGHPGYPDPVTKAEFLGPVSHLLYHQPLWAHRTSQRRFDFTHCQNTANFTTTGNLTATGFAGTVHFNEITRVTRLQFSAPTICVLDTYTYKVNGEYELDMWVQSINCTNLISMDYSWRASPVQTLGLPTSYQFDYMPGEINITDSFFTCDGMATQKGIVARGDSKSPQPSLGLINFTFTPTYLHSVTVEDHTVLQIKLNGKPSGTKFNDWITQSYALTTTLSIYTDGVITGFLYFPTSQATKTRNLYVEDFTSPVDWSCNRFDTATSTLYGTPNEAFGGSGVGVGGGPGPGANATYLGQATTDTLKMDTWVEWVDVVGCGHLMLGDHRYELPVFGDNACHRAWLRRKVSTLAPIGVAITQICYQTRPRIMVEPQQLPIGIYKFWYPTPGLAIVSDTITTIPPTTLGKTIFELL